MDQESSEQPVGKTPFPTMTSISPEVEEDYGPIEAFVKQDDDDTSVEEIEAGNVDVLPTRSEVAQQARSKLKKYSILGSLCLVITIIGVMVPLSLTVFRTKYNLRMTTNAPSQAPSIQPSNSPTTFELTEYVETLSQVSSLELLMTPGSPQYRASRWIYDVDPVQMDITHPRLLQRYIAAVFYYSTSNGSGWADCYPGDVHCSSEGKESWLSLHNECDWFGFTHCDDYGFVTKFEILNNQNSEGNTFHGNNLQGTLPSEFGYLTNLTDLTLVKNPFLVSSIPSSFSKLTKLRKLRLQFNGLQGPWHEGLLKNMTDLDELILNYNDFNMTLPLDIAEARSLSTLILSGNKFYGQIPDSYGNFHSMKRLELNENHISGEIPDDWFITNLEFLDFQGNDLVGAIPDSICVLRNEYGLKTVKIDCEVECNCCEPCNLKKPEI